jgi:hypothetical protein
MELEAYVGKLGGRWPFSGFILAIASLSLVVAELIANILLIGAAYTVFGMLWSGALKARFAVVGPPNLRWVIGSFAVLVLLTCELFRVFVPTGPVLMPGLFVLLHLPLVIKTDKLPR